LESNIIFVIASIALIVTPGPDFIYVLSRSLCGGKMSGMISATGVSCGIVVHTLAAACGLALLLQTSTTLFWIVKVAGSVYLISLGLTMVWANKSIVVNGGGGAYGKKRCFIQGFLSNLLNPKVALFFVAFLPQFVDKQGDQQRLQMIILGLAFGLMTIIFLVIIGFFAGTIGQWLAKKKRTENAVRIGSATTLILLGLQILIPNNR